MADYFEKIRNYCAYQERCHSEVKNKLAQMSIYGHDADEIIVDLIADDFLNEERFAQSYCRGKFQLKKWGKSKLVRKLKQKGVSDYCIQKGLLEIDENEYVETAKELIEKKLAELSSEKNIWKKKQKTLLYLVQKGFEASFVYDYFSSSQMKSA